MTIDVSPLSGDPLATQTEAEWAADMVTRLRTANRTVAKAIWKEMTQDEQDMLLAFCFAQVGKPA